MELHSFADVRPDRDPLRARIGRLIEVVGTSRFETEVFRLAREAIGCEHLTAFAVSASAPPRVLLAANTGELPIARSVARKYVAHYWKLDPANDLERFDTPDAANMALLTQPDDIWDSSYRQDCYTAVRLQDRFTIMQSRGAEVFRLSFYRGVGKGRFDAQDVERIMSSADLLLSLVVKHDVVSAPAEGDAQPALYQNRLRLLEPGMPLREAEVCSAIMRGMTSEAIALTLGISVNTVLTYRKRAYARLGISCQNELFRLVLS